MYLLVHLLVQARPSETVTGMVQRLKGGTSYVLRAELPELEEHLWGASFWADGYFCETVGKVDEETIRDYIRRERPLRGWLPPVAVLGRLASGNFGNIALISYSPDACCASVLCYSIVLFSAAFAAELVR